MPFPSPRRRVGTHRRALNEHRDPATWPVDTSDSLRTEAMMTSLHTCVRFLLLSIPLALVACSSGSGSPPPTNLTLQGLEVTGNPPRIGYPLSVTTRIEADRDVQNVSVSYFALNQEDVDMGLNDIRQVFLATVTIPLVESTVTEYATGFSIPPGINPPGDYVLLASLDPAGLVAETDENDNQATAEITLAPFQDPNLFIASLTLDSPVVVLDPDIDDVDEVPGSIIADVQNTDVGATVEVGVEGTLEPVDVEVFLALRITRPELPAGANTHDIPFYLWDSVAGDFVDSFGRRGTPRGLPLGSLLPQDVSETTEMDEITWSDTPPASSVAESLVTNRKSVHLEGYFPGGLAEALDKILQGFVRLGTVSASEVPPDLSAGDLNALWTFFDNGNPAGFPNATFTVVAELRAAESTFVDSDPTDSLRVSRELVLVSPGESSSVPERPLAFEQGSEGGWVNENFGVGFRFDAFASVDSRGGIAAVVGAVPVTVLDTTFHFAEFEARAQVVPQVAADRIPPGENSGFFLTLDALTIPGDPTSGITVFALEQPAGFVYEDDPLSVSKEKAYSSVFFVGPVPVTVSAGIGGEIGFRLAINLQPIQLLAEAGPFAELEAFVTGGVGIPGLNAGVGGALSLLKEEFQAKVDTHLEVRDFGDVSGTAIVHGLAHMSVVNTLTGPTGRLFLQATFPGPVWCNLPVVGWIPCGAEIKRAELVLVNWESFVKEDILFEETLCKAVTISSEGVTFSACVSGDHGEQGGAR